MCVCVCGSVLMIILSCRHCRKPGALQRKRRRPRSLRDLPVPDPEWNSGVQSDRPLDGSASSQCEIPTPPTSLLPLFCTPAHLPKRSDGAKLAEVSGFFDAGPPLQLLVCSPTPPDPFDKA